jgi:hypothetical protein
LFGGSSNGYKRQILHCTSLKSLADAVASPTFFASFNTKFATLSLVHDPPNKSIQKNKLLSIQLRAQRAKTLWRLEQLFEGQP